MPRARTPSRGRVANVKKSPSRARSRSRSRGRTVGGSPGRSPARVRSTKSPARRPAPAAALQETAVVAAASAAVVTPRSPIRVTRSRSPARTVAAVPQPAPLRESVRKETPPAEPAPMPARAAAVAAVTKISALEEPRPLAPSVLMTSTPKALVRARRSISRQPEDVKADEATSDPVTSHAAAPAPAPAPAPTAGTRHSERIANKLRQLGVDPSAGGDTTDAAPEENHVATKDPTAIGTHASWSRVFATPLVLLFAAVPFYLYSTCNKKGCRIDRAPEFPTSVRSYLDRDSLAAVPGWFLLQLLLAKLPLGPVAEGQISKLGLKRYRCNAIWTVPMTLAGAGLAFYLNAPVFEVLRKVRLLLVATTVWSLVLAVVLHVRSRRAHLLDLNPAGCTDSLLVNAARGRELSPQLLGVDLKLAAVRAAVSALALLTALYVLHERQQGQATPTLLAAAAMLGLLVFDRVWFEDSLLTTYAFMNEGLGLAWILGVGMMPFMALFHLRFITVTGVSQPWYIIMACWLLFTVGYLIHRSAISQKNQFRKNPVNPSLAHMEAIPTLKGKKLLVSGWWSVVRHPNHLGFLLMATALTLLLGFRHALGWILLPLLVAGTVRRCRQLDRHCQHKYGAAWQRYTDRVRRSLLPAVF